EQGQRQAQERHQVRALDEARLTGPRRQRERQRRRGQVRTATDRDAKKDRQRAEDERRLEQQRARDTARAMRERQNDLEQPSEVDVAVIGGREREQIRARDSVVVQDDLAQTQVEE